MTGCLSSAVSGCNCTRPAFIGCDLHIGKHLREGIDIQHSFFSIYKELNEKECANLLGILGDIRENRRTLKNDLVYRIAAGVERVQQKGLKALGEIDALFCGLLEILEKILAGKAILNEGIDERIRAIAKGEYSDFYTLDEDIEIVPKVVVKNMFYFEQNTRKLKNLDVVGKCVSIAEVQGLEKNMGYYAGICTVNERDIFYSGGSRDGSSNMSSCYIIDVKNRKAIKIPSLEPKRRRGSAVKCLDFVYVFGGIADRTTPHSAKFSLKH